MNTFSKKISYYIGILLLVASLFAPNVIGQPNIMIKIITTESTQFVYEVKNTTNKPIDGHVTIKKIEKIEKDSCVDVTSKVHATYTEEGFETIPSTKNTERLNILEPFESGDYSVIFEYSIFTGFMNKSIETKEITVNFTVERA